jgi:tryptophan halogenase
MSGPEDRTIRSIAVAGAGIVGLSAAIAFARALPKARVSLVALPTDPSALADRTAATMPTVHRFHAAVGLDELDLVRRSIALHRLGTSFSSWSASGEPWYLAFGDYGQPAGRLPFHQVWAAARGVEGTLPYHRYCAAALLAEAGKFVHPVQDTASPLSTYLYGLFLDPALYRARLEEQLEAQQIERIDGALASVERSGDGRVAAMLLGDGRRIEADLFIDCAGPSAPLLSALDDGFEDWSDSLPCDRLLTGEGKQAGPSSCDAAIAIPEGWLWTVPLPGRTLSALLYHSATPEAEARRLFAQEAGVEEAGAVAFRPGRRPAPWTGNVLALGDASVALDPLHGAGLHLAHSAILRALELLPGRDCHELELREYNRQTGQETLRVRDFLALHYLRSGRSEGAFWRSLEGRPAPESLAHTLEQFEERGRLPFYEEESFTPDQWAAALLGLGVYPRAADPGASGILDEAVPAMQGLAARLADLPERLPAYPDYLARMRAAGGR